MKKAILITMSAVATLIMVIFIYIYIGFYQMEKGSDAALRTFDQRTQVGKVSAARRIKIQEKIEQENIAREFYKKSDYDRSIKEYLKAIEMSKYDQWEPRYELSEVYEKAGYYDLALQEIDWLLSRKKVDKRVIDELLARKTRISSAMQK